jgi:hypothetical protein
MNLDEWIIYNTACISKFLLRNNFIIFNKILYRNQLKLKPCNLRPLNLKD